QGWGRWEINPKLLMSTVGNPNPQPVLWPDNDYLNLTRGDGSNNPGRYGNVAGVLPSQPQYPTPDRNAASLALPGSAPRAYGQVDYDGSTQTNMDPNGVRFQLPGYPGDPNQGVGTPFPTFRGRYQNGSVAERTAFP